MEYDISKMFAKAVEIEKKDSKLALEYYENIVKIFDSSGIYGYTDESIKIFAMANARLFTSSLFERSDNALLAIEYFENYLKKCYFDAQAQAAYIEVLEFTYQYSKAYSILLELLCYDSLQKIALTFLSSPVYVCEKLITHDDCIMYKKRLIDFETDENIKKELLTQLKHMEEI